MKSPKDTPSFVEAMNSAGIEVDVWEAPNWAKTTYAAAPAGQVVEALRAVASSEMNREAVVSARSLGGWRAAEDFIRSLLEVPCVGV